MTWVLSASFAATPGILPAFALPAFTLTASPKSIRVSATCFDSAFRAILRNGMRDKAAKREGVTLRMEDAAADASRQMDQVRDVISAGIDAILLTAVDCEGTEKRSNSRAAEEAMLPLVDVLYFPADLESLPKTSSFVGSNELDAGTLQSRELCRLIGGKDDGRVLMGPFNNHSSIVRTKDVHDAAAAEGCIGMTAVVVGIDATQAGSKAMTACDRTVTVFENGLRQSATAIDAAPKLARDEAVERNIRVPFELVTPATMARYQAASR